MNSNVSHGDDVQRAGEEIEDVNSIQNKRKRYHRHTSRQIEEMEAFFRDCPHPDNKQRNELSQALGMEPLQVKFWFQNKRTQMKAKHARHENSHLRAQNDKLRQENMRYSEMLSNACCPACGNMLVIGDVSLDERHLRVENARLKEEIDRISEAAAKYVGKPLTDSAANTPSSSGPRSTDAGTSAIFKVALSKGKKSVGDEDIVKPGNN